MSEVQYGVQIPTTSVNLTILNFFKNVSDFLKIKCCFRLLSFVFVQMEGNRTTQRSLRKAGPPEGRRRDITTTNFGCCFFSSLLVGGAAWPSPSLGRGAFTPARFGLVLFFRATSITQKSGRKAARPKGGGRQAAPPERRPRKAVPVKGRRREHHSTELNLTHLNSSY